MFDTVLIANRGEIACRIIRTLRTLGVRSVAVYSDADAGARHVALADVAVRLGAAAASESYLDPDKIIRAALDQGAQAIHPGYGFLAENAEFAARCAAAGIVFIGPGVAALQIMGDKISAKQQVSARGVPIVPGVAEPGLSDEELIEAAPAVGFPLLIKPSAGGGGKGMHRVESMDELTTALAAARREAASSFGDDTLFLERYVTNPRHIEVQVLADAHGTVVHVGERECSLQRRHQKVIEEAPSPLLDDRTRARITRAAIDTARSVDYVGAGTVEFIVSADAPDEFFFMEMNTRLQVEHPVSEVVTGIDLVQWQLRIAAGEPLDIAQDDIVIRGHAIEARVYAEDPRHGFLPTGGEILTLVEPSGDGIRVDSALRPGLVVTSDYDPMLAKVIAWAPDRAQALRRLRGALSRTVTLGVPNNVEFLMALLTDSDVLAGHLDTGLIGRRFDSFEFRDADAATFAIAALVIDRSADAELDRSAADTVWRARTGWRIGAHAARSYRVAAVSDGAASIVTVRGTSPLRVTVDDTELPPIGIEIDGVELRVRFGATQRRFHWAQRGRRVYLAEDGAAWSLLLRPFERLVDADAQAAPDLRSPMPGAVVAVFVEDGQSVNAGAAVLSVEAMKMEHVLTAPTAGTVDLRVTLGTQVAADEVLASITPAPA